MPSKANGAPLIKPQQVIEYERFNARLEKPIFDLLRQYATFIKSDQSYIINQALEAAFSSDKRFQQYLKEHPQDGKLEKGEQANV